MHSYIKGAISITPFSNFFNLWDRFASRTSINIWGVIEIYGKCLNKKYCYNKRRITMNLPQNILPCFNVLTPLFLPLSEVQKSSFMSVLQGVIRKNAVNPAEYHSKEIRLVQILLRVFSSLFSGSGATGFLVLSPSPDNKEKRMFWVDSGHQGSQDSTTKAMKKDFQSCFRDC